MPRGGRIPGSRIAAELELTGRGMRGADTMRIRVFGGAVALAALGLSACSPVGQQESAAPASAPIDAVGEGLNDAATLSVFIDLPPEAILTSPTRISGTADSRFFFEGVFPIRLLGANGCVLATAPALPRGEWMQPGQVPFEATLTFNAAPGSSAVLVFEEDIAGEDPLPPLQVTRLVKIAGTQDAARADPDPADCPTPAS